MPRKEEEKPIREAINQMLRAYGLGPKLDEIGLLKSWEEVEYMVIKEQKPQLQP